MSLTFFLSSDGTLEKVALYMTVTEDGETAEIECEVSLSGDITIIFPDFSDYIDFTAMLGGLLG